MKRISVCMALISLLCAPITSASEGIPSDRPSLDASMGSRCVPDRSSIERLGESIRDAGDLAEARSLAIRPTRLALSALSKTRWLSRGEHGDIDRAYLRLVEYQERVGAAQTPDEIALELETLLASPRGALAGVHPDVDVDIDDGGCDYSGGEIIATVLGFILGILPGIILLILLC